MCLWVDNMVVGSKAQQYSESFEANKTPYTYCKKGKFLKITGLPSFGRGR